jgi:hypothetical protein
MQQGRDNTIAGKPGDPSWSLLTPMNYSDTDLPTIEELRKRIAEFMFLPKMTMERCLNEEG